MKDQITQGEWQTHINGDSMSVSSKNSPQTAIAWIDKEYGSERFIHDAEAIVKAVNNTYGKGIDPEKIGEFINIIQEVKDAIYCEKPASIGAIEKLINKALESIKTG